MIPQYRSIQVYAVALRVLGWLFWLGTAGPIYWIATEAQRGRTRVGVGGYVGPDWAEVAIPVAIAGALLILGFFWMLASQLLGAYRHMTINSWRTAIASERALAPAHSGEFAGQGA